MQLVQEMLEQIEQSLLACASDGAYDKRKVYEALNQHSPNALIWQHGNSKEKRLPRDENLRYIRKHEREQWKQDTGYHIRSLAETIMFRLKIIFGARLPALLLETQTTQALIRCLTLIKMTHLGMPDCCSVAEPLLSVDLLCLFFDLCTKTQMDCKSMNLKESIINISARLISTYLFTCQQSLSH